MLLDYQISGKSWSKLSIFLCKKYSIYFMTTTDDILHVNMLDDPFLVPMVKPLLGCHVNSLGNKVDNKIKDKNVRYDLTI